MGPRQPAPARVLLHRALRLRCPACGEGPVFLRGLKRARRCSGCGREFERGAGYWVGGSEVHMIGTFALSGCVLFPLVALAGFSAGAVLAASAAHLALSIASVRHSRALFLALDYGLDPGPAAGPPGPDRERRSPHDGVPPPPVPRGGRRARKEVARTGFAAAFPPRAE